MNYKIFVNNPWGENTILLYDNTKEAVLIDCGALRPREQKTIKEFIKDKDLKLTALLNTHLHLDHIFGNNFILNEFNLLTQASKEDEFLIDSMLDHATMYGIQDIKQAPKIGTYLKDGDIIAFGETEIKVIAVRGHSPGGLCFYNCEDKILIAGDVLFAGSVGRADLPGGNAKLLITDIKQKLLTLDNDTLVIPGHGPSTTIYKEKMSNPFLGDSFPFYEDEAEINL